jgi:hypothetical protein
MATCPFSLVTRQSRSGEPLLVLALESVASLAFDGYSFRHL